MNVDEKSVSDADFLLQGDALIQSNLHMDAGCLDEETWAKRYAQAVWLESMRLKNLADLMVGLLGSGED